MINKSLTVMAPVYNEEENVNYFLERMLPQIRHLSNLHELDVKLTIIDNCSTDETVKLLARKLSDLSNIELEIF